MKVDISGATINIGSVSANVDSIYVQSGTMFQVSGNTTIVNVVGVTPSGTFNTSVTQVTDPWVVSGNVLTSGVISNFGQLGSSVVVAEQNPLDSSQNNPAWKFEYDAQNNIGSVSEFIDAGSFVNVLTWEGFSGTSIGIGSRVLNIGSFT